jgi:hypothetical protein
MNVSKGLVAVNLRLRATWRSEKIAKIRVYADNHIRGGDLVKLA